MPPRDPSRDPIGDWLAKNLGGVWEEREETPPTPYRDKYEDLLTEDVVKLSRGGYCPMACWLLYRELKIGVPYVILREGIDGTYAHYFLYIHEKALDLGGLYTIEELLRIFPNDGPVRETSWDEVESRFVEFKEVEWEKLEPRFKAYILANRDK